MCRLKRRVLWRRELLFFNCDLVAYLIQNLFERAVFQLLKYLYIPNKSYTQSKPLTMILQTCKIDVVGIGSSVYYTLGLFLQIITVEC